MTTTKTKAWLRAIGSMRFGDLAIANLEELHGMLHDLIHIDDVDALRAVLADRDLGEAVEVERWRDIETAPTDGTPHVRGLWVNSTKAGGYTYWESIAGAIDDGEGEFLDHDGNAPWHAEDYVHWMPLPAAPDAKP